MIAAETEQGLTRLGVLFENTLPFSPFYVARLVMWPRRPNQLSRGLSELFHAT